MELRDAVRRRRMVRSFADGPVPDALVDELLDLARRAPSAGNTQGTELLVLRGAEPRRRFWEAAFPQRTADFRWPSLLSAPVLVVPCASRQAYVDRYAEPDKALPGGGRPDDDRWCAPYWDIDCGMVVQTLLLAVVDAGLGAVFFGWRPEHTDAVRAAFAIPDAFRPVGAVAIGHPAADRPGLSAGRPRRPLEHVVHREGW